MIATDDARACANNCSFPVPPAFRTGVGTPPGLVGAGETVVPATGAGVAGVAGADGADGAGEAPGAVGFGFLISKITTHLPAAVDVAGVEATAGPDSGGDESGAGGASGGGSAACNEPPPNSMIAFRSLSMFESNPLLNTNDQPASNRPDGLELVPPRASAASLARCGPPTTFISPFT